MNSTIYRPSLWQQIQTLSPAAYLPLNDNSGSTAKNVAGATDGTYTGGVLRQKSAIKTVDSDAVDLNGTTDLITLADHAAIQNIWDSLGWIAVWAYIHSDGGSNQGRIWNKGGDHYHLRTQGETGGNVLLQFLIDFDTTDGKWITATDIAINTWTFLLLGYDADAVGNDPTLYKGIGNTLTTLTVGAGLTKIQTPVGTRVSDAADDLTIGNRKSAADRGFDGLLSNFAMGSGTITTAQVQSMFDAGR